MEALMEVDTLAKFPMLEGHVYDLRAQGLTTDAAIARIQRAFDEVGPYMYAKAHDLLVNASGEEFAIQFMSFFNEYAGRSVY